jgi:F-type H+-transporting ATPase subunit epsilon
MAEELTLEIVTPERMLFRGTVDEVTLPGTEGEFGVLRGHASLLSAMDHGELSFIKDHHKSRYAIHTGYAEVTASRVTVLVESAERSDMIDAERAKRAKQRAEAKLARLSREDVEYEKARLALVRAVTRLTVAGRG